MELSLWNPDVFFKPQGITISGDSSPAGISSIFCGNLPGKTISSSQDLAIHPPVSHTESIGSAMAASCGFSPQHPISRQLRTRHPSSPPPAPYAMPATRLASSAPASSHRVTRISENKLSNVPQRRQEPFSACASLPETGQGLSHAAKKTRILGLAICCGTSADHDIRDESIITTGTANDHHNQEWLEGLRRMNYTVRRTILLVCAWRRDPVFPDCKELLPSEIEGIKFRMGVQRPLLHVIPMPPHAALSDTGHQSVQQRSSQHSFCLFWRYHGKQQEAGASKKPDTAREINLKAFMASREIVSF